MDYSIQYINKKNNINNYTMLFVPLVSFLSFFVLALVLINGFYSKTILSILSFA
jgi:hypothetical protein